MVRKEHLVQPLFTKRSSARQRQGCGRVIRVVSVFPKQGTETPADKLKALAELEFQQGKMCA